MLKEEKILNLPFLLVFEPDLTCLEPFLLTSSASKLSIAVIVYSWSSSSERSEAAWI